MYRRRRNNRKILKVIAPPAEVDLEQVAKSCRYVGNPYHKRNPSFAGQPRRKPDASICPSELSKRHKLVESWLKNAVESGNVGEFDKYGYPLRVWYRMGDTIYEAKPGAKGSGEYHGYPLERNQVVRGLR